MEVKYHPLVLRVDLASLDKVVKEKIRTSIERKLMINPLLYGIPLRNSLRNLRRLRVGDYRIVFLLKEGEVFILAIGHRKDIYKKAGKRN